MLTDIRPRTLSLPGDEDDQSRPHLPLLYVCRLQRRPIRLSFYLSIKREACRRRAEVTDLSSAPTHKHLHAWRSSSLWIQSPVMSLTQLPLCMSAQSSSFGLGKHQHAIMHRPKPPTWIGSTIPQTRKIYPFHEGLGTWRVLKKIVAFRPPDRFRTAESQSGKHEKSSNVRQPGLGSGMSGMLVAQLCFLKVRNASSCDLLWLTDGGRTIQSYCWEFSNKVAGQQYLQPGSLSQKPPTNWPQKRLCSHFIHHIIRQLIVTLRKSCRNSICAWWPMF